MTGEWPCYRGNGRQDGRATVPGRIAQPHIAWKQFVGVAETWQVVEPDRVAAAEAIGGPEDPRWGLTAPYPQTSTTAYAHVLPGEPEIQKIEFESAFSKPTRDGDWAHDCVGRCFVRKDGDWRMAWQSEPIDALFSPQPLVGDFDGDGAPEVAILPWKELLLLDARTGRVKHRCVFTDGRIYGFFGASDLDGDGRVEFVVQADFSKHVDVLGWRGGPLSLLWKREIELDISDPQIVLRVPPEPAADVDGDGKKEILVPLYNADGARRWRLDIHDGLTGAVKAQLADEYLQGVLDVDGDGVAELLTVRARGAGIPTRGRLSVWSLRGGAARRLWGRESAAYQTGVRPQPPDRNSGATLGERDVVHRVIEGRAEVVLRTPGGLVLARWGERGFAPRCALRGPGLEALALDASGRLLVRGETPPGAPAAVSVRGGRRRTIRSSERGIPPVSCAVVREAGAPRPTVLVAGALGREEIVAFEAPSGEAPARERGRLAGRGTGFHWPSAQMHGPVAGDLFGDGRRQHLYATSAPDGAARLVAADLSGRTVWSHDFPEIPGGPPLWNVGGLLWWQAGRFTDARRQDVVVSVRRSMMHSEETLLLSGKDGQEIWRRRRLETPRHRRGVGGTPFAVHDFDGDGLDDLALLHPSEVALLDGATGKDLLLKAASWKEVPGQEVYWGIPIAGDFEGKGAPGIFFGTTRRSLIGLVRAEGSLAWWDARDRATLCLPAFGDFTGAGRTEAVGIGFDDGMRCYDAATGALRWRLPYPADAPPTDTASADIDGDGRDEMLFTAGRALYCVGGAPEGKLRWKIELPAVVGPPVIADADGSGTATILLAGSDGYVYGIR